jgi:hypothetical protein
VSSALIHVAGLDLERGYERAFNRWYEDVHVPGVLKRPGWSALRRYECLEGEPRYLAIYDLTEAALEGEVSAAPFRDPAFGRRIRDYHARTWRRILAAGEDPAAADLINLITVDIGPEHAEPFSRWYSETHVPEILACPGWLGGERYESIDGDPRFLAMYGLEDAERPFGTDEYESVWGWEEQVEHMRGYHGFRIYRLIGRFER